MPLRPIDAIFIYPQLRCYVVYHQGELWQLTRMKLDDVSWQRRKPFEGDITALHLSRKQTITDPKLARKLHTLVLPEALHGISLSKFKAWWRANGKNYYKKGLNQPGSPAPGLLNEQTLTEKSRQDRLASADQRVNSAPSTNANNSVEPATKADQVDKPYASATSPENIFDDMLMVLTDEVRSAH